ncbi:MAG: glycosyltransferase N-terminal domain-containing protein [Bacteriovoracaceae bacterium]
MHFKLFFIIQTLIIFPVVNLLSLFIPILKKRKAFEKENFNIINSNDWHADIAFEVSSEGEFEQIISLCEIYLSQNKKIELIFCSESAVDVVTKWAKDKSSQVRVLRLPLITNIPFVKNRSILKFLTAKVLVLCRYDFFPELLYYGIYKAEKFVLLDATLIHKFDKLKGKKGLTCYIYNQFDLIITSTQSDIERISSAFQISKQRLSCFNFRTLRIISRVSGAENKLAGFSSFALFLDFLNKFEYKKRIILGNFYSNETELLSEAFVAQIQNREILSLIVPHKIEEQIHTSLRKYTINFNMTRLEMEQILNEYLQNPGLLILKQKGVLCELFHYFSVAYVGGGFFGSVHSILEPHLSGAFVICGPNIQRSTEFELAKNRDERSVVSINNQSDFFKVAINHIQSIHAKKDLGKSFNEQKECALQLSSTILKI